MLIYIDIGILFLPCDSVTSNLGAPRRLAKAHRGLLRASHSPRRPRHCLHNYDNVSSNVRRQPLMLSGIICCQKQRPKHASNKKSTTYKGQKLANIINVKIKPLSFVKLCIKKTQKTQVAIIAMFSGTQLKAVCQTNLQLQHNFKKRFSQRSYPYNSSITFPIYCPQK